MKLWTYRGWRVRKYYRHIKLITFLLFYFPFLVINGFGHYLNYTKATDSPYIYGIISVLCLVIPGIACYQLNRFLYEKVLFFGRLDNLRIASNYLYENGFYYTKKPANGKEKIKFPKVYLKRDTYGLDLTFILQGNKFQDRFLNMGGMLETMFDGDFMAKTFEKGFVTYTIILDQIRGRINVGDVKVDSNGLRLMDSVYWNYDEQPHLLVSGGTGGGKTVTLMSIIKGLAEVGTVKILDPKKSDFVGLKDAPVFNKQVFFEKEDMMKCIEDTVEEMNRRYLYMTNHKDYAAGKRYSDYGLRPIFLIADEWAAFISTLKFGEESTVIEMLTQIVLKGRQAGVIMILALQRPDGEYIKTSIRDNFMKRLSVGHLEEQGYFMMYGDANRSKVFKKIDKINGKKVRGRGYIANGGEIAQEFFSPYVPFEDGYSFLDEFMKMPVLPEDPSIQYQFPSDKEEEKKTEETKEVIEQDDTPLEEDFKTYSTADLAKKLKVSPAVVRKVTTTILDLTEVTFDKDDKGRYVFSEDDLVMFTSLVDRKETFEGTWSELVKEYFGV
ncbi:FtsK/SpoIIIE domain-containing protein [Streptococcus sp. zg-JUN1979]|uniref:FtsK/SpoIIIE domain-containing protein n=1 Tax=Streptococcus sp. zg-JUN1979 TaxID=3391450 RepID=UPI0039A4EB9D